MDEDIKSLGTQEREILKDLASTFIAIPASIKTQKAILSIEEWLASYYHTGELGKALYPFWKTELESIFSGTKISFDELIVTGGIRTGKTWLCWAVWLRMLYLLSMLDNPQEYLGLAQTTEIVFAYLSISIDSALKFGFGEFVRIVDSCEYFNSEFPRNKRNNTTLSFPKNIMFVCGSNFSHFISSAMLSMFFDEGNFAKTGGGKEGDLDKAMKIYANARTRTKTQFSTEKNRQFIINMLVSSSTHKGSFTESLITSSKGINSTKVLTAPVWVTKPKGTYSENKFLFFSGTELFDPKIIDKKEDLKPILRPEQYEKILDGSSEILYNAIPMEFILNFHLVPENFRPEFTKIPKQAVQDILGLSLATTGKFFINRPAWERAVQRGNTIPLKHPFSKLEINLSRQDDKQIRDYIDVNYLKAVIGSNSIYVHVDQSESGCSTGITIAFPIRLEGENLCRIVVPLKIRIVPLKDDKISLVKIRVFLEDLRDLWGFNIGKITFDQYQSSVSLEILEERGFPVGKLSVENDSPWFEVADVILTERLVTYDYQPLTEEWFELIHNVKDRKIEKPKNGSKDVADSFCGAVYNCVMSVDPKPDMGKQGAVLEKIFNQVNGNGEPDYGKILSGGLVPLDEAKVKVNWGNIKVNNDNGNPWKTNQEKIQNIWDRIK
jgi:hypothetical protein